MKVTNNYRYLNVNPQGIEEEDCVTRAICFATGIDYNVIANLLKLSAKVNHCDKLCVCCYHHLLEDVFGFECKFCKRGERVADVMQHHPRGKIIMRLQGHLTSCIDGVCVDVWNCTDKKVDCYWIVKSIK